MMIKKTLLLAVFCLALYYVSGEKTAAEVSAAATVNDATEIADTYVKEDENEDEMSEESEEIADEYVKEEDEKKDEKPENKDEEMESLLNAAEEDVAGIENDPVPGCGFRASESYRRRRRCYRRKPIDYRRRRRRFWGKK